MTEAERCTEKIAAARRHPGLADAMRTPPPTWLKLAIIMCFVMAGSWCVTLLIMPSGEEMDRASQVNPIIRVQMIMALAVSTAATIACVWLLFDAIGLAAAPTRYMIAVVEQRVHTPAPYFIRLITEDGADREYRARRRAASTVKLGLVEPGQVGVAVMKGDVCVQWVPLPLHHDRVYDRL